ncbi:MAG: GNAT family N-acetyltransferase [Anaerolineales bacterium]
MSEITIRKVEGDERVDIFHWFNHYAFNPSLPYPDKEETAKRIAEREGVDYLVLFEDDEPVSTIASTPLIQNVRGEIYEVGGVFDVITHPNARRKGYAYRLLTEIFEAIKGAGQPFTCLYPFRESFYERMGYVTFPQPLKAKFIASGLAPLLKADIPGGVEIMLIGEGYLIYRDYLVEFQKHIHGAAYFKHVEPSLLERATSWLAVAKVNGEIEGVMVYTLKGNGPVGFDFRAQRFYAHTIQGRYLLLNWIARHIDHAGEVELWLPPAEQPNTWLSDLGIKTEPAWLPGMGRVLDVSQIAGMHVGPGRFSIELNDPSCPWNEGVWTFEEVDGKLQVEKGKKVDCCINIQGLSALIYGTNDPACFAIRGWGRPKPEVQAIMRDMFPLKKPYLLEYF